MLRYLPLILTAVLIAGVTAYNGAVTDRWNSGVNSRAELAADYLKLVPMEVGLWKAQENENVDERIRRVAGAVGSPVSRTYVNEKTGEAVDLWLIVGHAAQIVRHTPNICYETAGFRAEQANQHWDIEVEGQPAMRSWTNVFYHRVGIDDVYYRVFWMWHKPQPGTPILWDAPGHAVKDARDRYAGAKALYKMYFTTRAARKDELPDESPAQAFAQDFVPVLNGLLEQCAEGKPAPTQAVTETTEDGAEGEQEGVESEATAEA